MARAAVRVDDLERGDLPALCAKTGVACDGLVRDSLRVVPRWVAASVYAFVVPFLILRLYFSRRVEAKLPIAPARVQRIRGLVRAAWIAIVIAAAGLASAIFGAGARRFTPRRVCIGTPNLTGRRKNGFRQITPAECLAEGCRVRRPPASRSDPRR